MPTCALTCFFKCFAVNKFYVVEEISCTQTKQGDIFIINSKTMNRLKSRISTYSETFTTFN